MTSLWKILIFFHTLKISLADKGWKEKRENFREAYGREKEKSFLLIALPFQKVFYWNQEGFHSLKKLGDRKRIEEKIFGYENQVI